ncbi:MAG: addiction module antidote protein, HigA family [Clostridia bacterium]|nr:addiction module antidote protein, HigA family [Clostridia bacterium]
MVILFWGDGIDIKYRKNKDKKMCTDFRKAKEELGPIVADKLLSLINFLESANDLMDVKNIPMYQLHPLEGDRRCQITMSRLEYNNIVAYHPGYYVKEMIEEFNITQDEMAKRLDVTSKYLSDFVNGKAKLSEEMMIKLSRVFGTSTELWLNLNAKYIEKSIEIEKLKMVEEECAIAQKIDYTFFVDLGILPAKRNICDKVDELHKYFKVASLKVLNRQDFLVQYKSAVANIADVNIINANAWVQTAINMGRDVETKDFDETKLKKSIEEIRSMTKQDPKEFVGMLKEILKECGVALILIPHLKNSGVNGAVKWLDSDKVLIALNDRNKYADYFWFALFHELGHVLQKRKKLLIISDASEQEHEKSELMDRLENEANQYARNTLIDDQAYKTFTDKIAISTAAILKFSEENGIHPGIVVGRLQRDGLLAFNQNNDLKVKYEMNVKRD